MSIYFLRSAYRVFWRYFTTALVLASLLSVGSCKTIHVEKPRESYLPISMKPAISEFPLQIEIDLKKMESSVNKSLKGLLYEGTQLNNQDLSVKVWKASDIKFTVKNNSIEYQVPLKLWARYGWKFEKFGISMGDSYEAEGSIILSYNTSFDIDKKWKLAAKTISLGYQWTETPRVSVAGISFPVASVANIVLSQSADKITREIDEVLSDMVDVKEYALMAWDEVQNPVEVNEENHLWVKVKPENIYLTPFKTEADKLKLGMLLTGLVESYMNVEAPPATHIPLPAYQLRTELPKDFNVNLMADATFDEITNFAKNQLLNKTFSEGRKSITITDLSLYGSEGRAMVELEVTGSVKGKIYFSGIPQYNSQKMAVEIAKPEFDLKTKNALLKSTDWLLHGFILNKLTPYLTYSVKEDLEELMTEANQLLAGYQVYDGITMSGQLNKIDVQQIDLIPGALRLSANVKGNVKLMIGEITF